MRKIFTLLIALMALTVSSWATPIQVGDFYYEIHDYGVTYAELVKLSGAEDWKSYYEVTGDITIPGTINDGVSDYPVYIIGNTAFGSCTGITSVTVEEGVDYISNFAFMGCSNLTTATLPSTITSFGNQAFGYSGLTSITIRATSPADISSENPFANADNLAHIYVPAASVDAYKTAWSDYASIIEEIPSGPSPTIITWDVDEVNSISLSCSSEGESHTASAIDGITASLTRTSSEGYKCEFDSKELWISGSCGKATFTSAVGNISGIVITCGQVWNTAFSAGWTYDSEGGTVTWAGTASNEVILSGDIDFMVSSIEFIIDASAPAPATTTTTITWDQADIESLGLADNDVDEFSASNEINDITASLTRTNAGQNTYCQISNRNFWITNGCGSLTFSHSTGKISNIVITYDDNYSYHSLSNLSAGWTEDTQAHTLTWTGTASDEVTLSGGMDILVSSIEFTVVTEAAPADPVSQGPVTWDFANDAELTSIYLTQYTHYDFNGYYSEYYDNHYDATVKDFKGIVATISAMIDGSYASFSTQNNYSIDLSGGGTLTFSTDLGQFESIVVNTNSGSGRSSGDWTWDITEKTLTWSGTPSNSVVLDNIYVNNITSIVFTFVSAASADPEPEPIPGPSFTWEQRQVNHVRLIGNSSGDPETAPVIKNIITSITQTSNGGNCYFGYWGNKGKLNIGNCGYLTFKSIVGDLRAIVITCSSVTTAEDLSTDWTYDGEAGTLTWKGTTASDEVTLSGYLNIDIAEIEFYYTPASAPRLGQTFYDAAYQLYEITGAQTAKVAQQQWLSHTLDIPASVEDGGVTYYITEIDDYAFKDDLELPNVMGGANISRVGAHAFDGCLRMDEIDIQSEVLDEIGEAAFRGCKLMQDIGFYTELPPVLGTNAFDDTRYLNHILVPYGNLEVYQAASGWSTYAAKINTTYSDPQVGEQFFYHNQTTTNIYAVLRTSPKEAKVLPYTAEVNAIYPITRTGTLVIPEEALYIHNMYTITGIGANAYKDSTRFTTVMMPIAVKLIEEGAFRNCTGVEKVYFLWDDPTTVTWADANQGLDFKTAASGNTKIFVPENRLAAYQEWAPAWASCMIGADILDVTATGDPHNNLRHYRTFYDSQADYLLPPSVWAHAGYVSGSDFILTPVAFDGEILPRGTAVVLESETPTYRLIPVGNGAPLYTGRNDLVGTDVDIPRTSVGNNGENVYVLNKQYKIGDDLRVGMGMYKYTGTTLGAHKAYLIYNAPSGPNNAPIRFLFNREEQATGFENIQEGNASCTKILRDGQLIIIKDNKEYNAQGLIIK